MDEIAWNEQIKQGTTADQDSGTLDTSKDPVPYTVQRIEFWNSFANEIDKWAGRRENYQRPLRHIYQTLVPPGMRVLELGCSQGDLLASLQPAYGVGVDFSTEMVARARRRYPEHHFVQADAHSVDLRERFDYIVCADLVNDLWDVQRVFEAVARHSHSETRLIVNAYSRVWELPRKAAEFAGIVKSQLPQNWLTASDIEDLLFLAGFETLRTFQEILLPIGVPVLSNFANRFLVKLPPFRWFALANFVVARPRPAAKRAVEPIVTVVVPARNEAGNVPEIFARVPEMGAGTDLIFVEGNSSDNTYAAIEAEIAKTARPRVRLLKQPGKGKGDAVRTGFDAAEGDILMILDADLTVPPEDLPRFYEAWLAGADFVNGVRLVYPMEEKAMRFFNMLGNKFFSLVFTWLLGQSIKDTLCGTKVLSKKHYQMIAANRDYFGDIDPFGDFDLLFGAAKYNLKIAGLPVRYRQRVYGTTNIQRWKHGVLLLRMAAKAMFKLKFV